MSFNQAVAPDRFPMLALTEGLRTLNHDIAGDIVTAGDPSWDSARQAWALAVDQRPAAVALPESPEDIVTIVNFARAYGLRVPARGGRPCSRRRCGSSAARSPGRLRIMALWRRSMPLTRCTPSAALRRRSWRRSSSTR